MRWNQPGSFSLSLSLSLHQLLYREQIFIEPMTSDRTLKAAREGWNFGNYGTFTAHQTQPRWECIYDGRTGSTRLPRSYESPPP